MALPCGLLVTVYGSVQIYELVAVLHHKGGSASHGHYTAEIKDIQSGK